MVAPYITIGQIRTNSTDVAGVRWLQGKIEGLGAPQGTLAPEQKPRQRGAWAGDSFAKGSSIVVNGTMVAPDAATAWAALDVLNESCPLYDSVLTYVTPLGSRWLTVRRDGEVLPAWVNDRVFTWSVQFFAEDPRKFGDELSASTFLPASVGGLTVPFTVPFTINAMSVSGQVSLTNPGNETGPVWLRIDGPSTGPVVTHVSSGLALTFSSSLVLQAGEWLDVDMEKHTVLANGQASRSRYVTSRGWSGFEPGDNVWQFTAASFDAASKLTVRAVPSWE